MPTEVRSARASRARRPAVESEMALEHLRELASDGEDRIERGHRVLEDHREFAPADPFELALGAVEQFGAVEAHASADADAPPRQ